MQTRLKLYPKPKKGRFDLISLLPRQLSFLGCLLHFTPFPQVLRVHDQVETEGLEATKEEKWPEKEYQQT